MKLFAYCEELKCVPTNLLVTLSASEGPIESLLESPTYKHKEYYLYFDPNFDNEDDDDDDDDDDNGSIVDKEAKCDDVDPFHASPVHQQLANNQHATYRPRCQPIFISCPNGTLFCVFSYNNSQMILDTSHIDFENILLLQGQFCSRRLWHMSEVFINDAREQALLQGPKAL